MSVISFMIDNFSLSPQFLISIRIFILLIRVTLYDVQQIRKFLPYPEKSVPDFVSSGPGTRALKPRRRR